MLFFSFDKLKLRSLESRPFWHSPRRSYDCLETNSRSLLVREDRTISDGLGRKGQTPGCVT